MLHRIQTHERSTKKVIGKYPSISRPNEFKLFSQENSISQKESLRLLKIWSVKMTSIQKSCVNLSLFLRLSL